MVPRGKSEVIVTNYTCIFNCDFDCLPLDSSSDDSSLFFSSRTSTLRPCAGVNKPGLYTQAWLPKATATSPSESIFTTFPTFPSVYFIKIQILNFMSWMCEIYISGSNLFTKSYLKGPFLNCLELKFNLKSTCFISSFHPPWLLWRRTALVSSFRTCTTSPTLTS